MQQNAQNIEKKIKTRQIIKSLQILQSIQMLQKFMQKLTYIQKLTQFTYTKVNAKTDKWNSVIKKLSSTLQEILYDKSKLIVISKKWELNIKSDKNAKCSE